MLQPFRYYLRVRYAECDAQKVVFNVHYGHYVDLATLEYLRTLGFEDLLVNGSIDYQLVRQTIEWKSSARFDQTLEISVQPKHLGNTSFSLSVEFRIADAEAVIATAETIYVMVDAVTLVKTPLPPEFRGALEQAHTDYASIMPTANRARPARAGNAANIRRAYDERPTAGKPAANYTLESRVTLCGRGFRRGRRGGACLGGTR